MFLDSFINNYTNNEEFCGSLITSPCKAYDVKVDGVPNMQYRTDVLKIFLAIYTSEKKRHLSLFHASLWRAIDLYENDYSKETLIPIHWTLSR